MSKVHPTEINRLQSDLIKKLAWGTADQWHSSMFSELSQKVFEITEIKLSPTTLKRFFGVLKYDGTPSITTLDALSRFLGFENWRAFKFAEPVGPTSLKEGLSHKFIYGTIGFFAAFIVVLLIANRPVSPPPPLPEGITFSSRSVTNTYPNSVVFDFDLKSVQSDSLQIQQYWDPTKTISIKKDQKQATGIYYFPGYFEAKLMVNGEAIRKHDLFLRSNGWLGTIEYEPIPKYFTPQSNLDKKLHSPTSIENEISNSKEPLVIAYHYINDLGNVSGDDFHLKANIRTAYDDKWAVCQSSRIYIIGTDGAMIIPFSKPGCSSNNNLMLNDLYLNGKEHDLSAFGADFSDFTAVEIINEQKKLSILIDGEEVFSSSYAQSMGRFVGLRFKFLGMGEVASFELLDQNGEAVVL